MSLILLVLQIIISILLIIVILLQRSDSDGFGLGASGGSNFLSSRGQANLITKLTSILAAAFMANSLLLATINARSNADSIADEIMLEQSKNKDFQVPIEGENVGRESDESGSVESDRLEDKGIENNSLESKSIENININSKSPKNERSDDVKTEPDQNKTLKDEKVKKDSLTTEPLETPQPDLSFPATETPTKPEQPAVEGSAGTLAPLQNETPQPKNLNTTESE